MLLTVLAQVALADFMGKFYDLRRYFCAQTEFNYEPVKIRRKNSTARLHAANKK